MGPLIDVDDDDNVFQTLYDDVTTHAHEGRVLYLSRHGESEFNLYGKIGVNFRNEFKTLVIYIQSVFAQKC